MRWAAWAFTAAVLVLALWANIARGQTLEGRRPGGYVVPPDRTSSVQLEVLVDGSPQRTIHHKGKVYLPVAKLGEEYSVRVWNHGSRRVLAVVSVDGLSVISGKPASRDGMGYVIDAGRSVTIKGWRRDLGFVAAFRFTSRDDSYAARKGHAENVGVIGLVAFEERRWPPRLPLDLKAEISKGAKRSSADAAVRGTGTGYGRDIGSRAYVVSFERGRVVRSLTVYYDTASALRKAGVPVDWRSPDPFPRPYEFALPPPGHRGR
jgi:hypothetical protein